MVLKIEFNAFLRNAKKSYIHVNNPKMKRKGIAKIEKILPNGKIRVNKRFLTGVTSAIDFVAPLNSSGKIVQLRDGGGSSTAEGTETDRQINVWLRSGYKTKPNSDFALKILSAWEKRKWMLVATQLAVGRGKIGAVIDYIVYEWETGKHYLIQGITGGMNDFDKVTDKTWRFPAGREYPQDIPYNGLTRKELQLAVERECVLDTGLKVDGCFVQITNAKGVIFSPLPDKWKTFSVVDALTIAMRNAKGKTRSLKRPTLRSASNSGPPAKRRRLDKT